MLPSATTNKIAQEDLIVFKGHAAIRSNFLPILINCQYIRITYIRRFKAGLHSRINLFKPSNYFNSETR
jgi:hypothetical protein